MSNRMTPASAVRKNPVTYSWLLNTYYRTSVVKPTEEEVKLAEVCLEHLRSRGWSHAAMDEVERVFERYSQLKASNDSNAAAAALSEFVQPRSMQQALK